MRVPRSSLTPEAVILCAADLADQMGLSTVSVAAVARSLSVQAPSLYGHVRDVAALRDGITVLALNELNERSARALAGRSRRDALRAICDVHRDYARRHPGRWEALQRRAGETVVRSSAAAEAGQGLAAVLRGYGIPESDRVHATRLIGAFLNGFVHLEHIGSFSHSRPDSGSSWDELIGRLHTVLAGWSITDAKDPSKEDR